MAAEAIELEEQLRQGEAGAQGYQREAVIGEQDPVESRVAVASLASDQQNLNAILEINVGSNLQSTMRWGLFLLNLILAYIAESNLNDGFRFSFNAGHHAFTQGDPEPSEQRLSTAQNWYALTVLVVAALSSFVTIGRRSEIVRRGHQGELASFLLNAFLFVLTAVTFDLSNLAAVNISRDAGSYDGWLAAQAEQSALADAPSMFNPARAAMSLSSPYIIMRIVEASGQAISLATRRLAEPEQEPLLPDHRV